MKLQKSTYRNKNILPLFTGILKKVLDKILLKAGKLVNYY